jgi:hypothetical protein
MTELDGWKKLEKLLVNFGWRILKYDMIIFFKYYAVINVYVSYKNMIIMN